jgi:hypothetical protein
VARIVLIDANAWSNGLDNGLGNLLKHTHRHLAYI